MSDLELIRDGRHYDALKAQNDVAFYLAQAQAASGPVLEIGCGTGRVTVPLAAAGVERRFAVMKRHYGFRRVRYLGLLRNACHLHLLCTAINLRRALVIAA